LDKLKKERFEKEEKKREKERLRSSKVTAELLKTSPSKIEKVRTILDKRGEKVKEAVLKGDITINKAYAETLKKPTPHFLRFEGDGFQVALTMNRNVGEVEWIILGSGECPNLPANSGNSKTLHLKSERFD